MVKNLDLKQVIARVELEGIRLVQLSASATIRHPSEAGPVDLPVSWACEVETTDGNTFYVRATVDMKVVPRQSPPPQKAAVRVEQVFELAYKLPEETAANSEVLTQFASTNGIFNAWPYARQLAHEISHRMSLPPLVLPLLRLSEVQPEQASDVGRAAEASNTATATSADPMQRPPPTRRKARSHSPK